MKDYLKVVIQSVKSISLQIDGINEDEINSNLILLGNDSYFDSFSMLLLLVELEQNLDSEILAGHSLIEWLSTLDFTNSQQMTLKQFADCLFKDYLKV